MRCFTATDSLVVLAQLSQEALMAQLHVSGLARPLLVHTSAHELGPVYAACLWAAARGRQQESLGRACLCVACLNAA